MAVDKKATLTYVQLMKEDLAVIRLVPEDGVIPDYETGQFITLGMPIPSEDNKMIRRAYSIASHPENKRFLEFYFFDPKNIEFSKKKLKEIFNDEYIYTWSDLNKSLFSALEVERNVMFIILSLIIIVAAFNIISGLTILVKNKTRDIGILKSIGVQNYSIKKIFFLKIMKF